MGISTARARAYIRCHQKFGDDPAAAKVFTLGVHCAFNSLTENDGETSDDASAVLKLLTGARSHDRPNNAAQ